MSVPGWFSGSDCTKRLCQHSGLAKTLWRENHSLHHFGGSGSWARRGWSASFCPARWQPDPGPATVSGLLCRCGHGAERLDCQRPFLPTLGATRVAGRSLFLVPFRQGAPLCTQLNSGEGQRCREFTVQCPGLWPSVSSEQSPGRRECPWQGCVS